MTALGAVSCSVSEASPRISAYSQAETRSTPRLSVICHAKPPERKREGRRNLRSMVLRSREADKDTKTSDRSIVLSDWRAAEFWSTATWYVPVFLFRTLPCSDSGAAQRKRHCEAVHGNWFMSVIVMEHDRFTSTNLCRDAALPASFASGLQFAMTGALIPLSLPSLHDSRTMLLWVLPIVILDLFVLTPAPRSVRLRSRALPRMKQLERGLRRYRSEKIEEQANQRKHMPPVQHNASRLLACLGQQMALQGILTTGSPRSSQQPWTSFRRALWSQNITGTERGSC
jgi:hypothetical protein